MLSFFFALFAKLFMIFAKCFFWGKSIECTMRLLTMKKIHNFFEILAISLLHTYVYSMYTTFPTEDNKAHSLFKLNIVTYNFISGE